MQVARQNNVGSPHAAVRQEERRCMWRGKTMLVRHMGRSGKRVLVHGAAMLFCRVMWAGALKGLDL